MATNANLIVGLTGGMGSGKSTAAALFVEHGFRRLDADQVIRDELYRSSEVIALVQQQFGPGVLDGDGQIVRQRVADIVFRDDKALAWLEGVLHPRLNEHWRRLFAASRGTRFIVEVPLLFEKGMENWFDFTVCVNIDSSLQLRRLEQRGVPPGSARERLAKQLPLERKCELADFVLLNDGSLDFLREQVSTLAHRLIQNHTA